jgi:hypothetical protein
MVAHVGDGPEGLALNLEGRRIDQDPASPRAPGRGARRAGCGRGYRVASRKSGRMVLRCARGGRGALRYANVTIGIGVV